jgi:spartin
MAEQVNLNPYAGLANQVHSAMDELSADTSQYVPNKPATELFRLDDSVQIFFVTADGHVSTFSAPESLRIFKFDSFGEEEEGSAVFLQVGGWTHPLIPDASPCLLAENGALMFPDIYSDTPQSSVGLVFTEAVDQDTKNQLLTQLKNYTAYKAEPQKAEYDLGKMGGALVKGAELISKGIATGADKAGGLIEYVTDKTQQSIQKAESDAKVGSLTRASVTVAKHTTNATVKVSGYVADRVGNLTKSLANYLGNVAAKPVAGSASGSSVEKKPGARAYLADLARGGIVAYGTVYNNLEENAKTLGNQMKTNSVKIMQHKYGEEAGGVWGDAMTAAGNGAMTYLNIQSLGAKGLIKSTAKQTGKNVAHNIINSHSNTK